MAQVANEAITIEKYVSGNGHMTIARWTNSTTRPADGDFVEVGDVEKFEFNPKVTKKNHKAHRGGVQAIDNRVSVYQEGELKFTLTSFVIQNLNLFFMSELATADETGQIMTGLDYIYEIRFDQELRVGDPKRYTFFKADITPAEALQLIADGEGEGDWAKMAFSAFLLKDPTLGWGEFGPIPTE